MEARAAAAAVAKEVAEGVATAAAASAGTMGAALGAVRVVARAGGGRAAGREEAWAVEQARSRLEAGRVRLAGRAAAMAAAAMVAAAMAVAMEGMEVARAAVEKAAAATEGAEREVETAAATVVVARAAAARAGARVAARAVGWGEDEAAVAAAVRAEGERVERAGAARPTRTRWSMPGGSWQLWGRCSCGARLGRDARKETQGDVDRCEWHAKPKALWGCGGRADAADARFMEMQALVYAMGQACGSRGRAVRRAPHPRVHA